MHSTGRTRHDDEATLDVIRSRVSGTPVAEIAARHGISEDRVSVATNRVWNADRKESGEPEGAVNACYWTVDSRRAFARGVA